MTVTYFLNRTAIEIGRQRLEARDSYRPGPKSVYNNIPPHPILEGNRLSHTTREKAKLLARVRRIRGQIEAVERALESEAGCSDVLHLLAASRGAMNGLMAEVIEDHVREHVAANDLTETARAEGTDELLDVIRAYLK